MDIPRYWYVINNENLTSVDDKDGESEVFDNEAAAIERAKCLARGCPGAVYEVVSTDCAFVAPVADVELVTILK